VLEREYSDLEEVWKAEKATLQGATKLKEQIEAARLNWKQRSVPRITRA
jgi:ATP-dependent Clp protease ATP-binding subunit ClpB